MQDLHKRSPGKISVQDLYKSSIGNWKDLCKRPLGKISATNLCNKSLCNVSVHGLHKRCPGKISVQDLYRGLLARSLDEISVETVYKSSLGKILCKGPLRDFSTEVW